ncbi:MAG: hypothetical protein WCP20_04640 [Desulfuromonadales bacterium]
MAEKSDHRERKPSQKKYDLFRSIGNAIRRIREEDELLPQRTGSLLVYVLEHVTPTAVKLNTSYPKRVQIKAFENIEKDFRKVETLPDDDKPAFQHYPNTYIIGYDIELQEYKDELHKDYPAKLLSHQFYFNFAGHRFGVIIITNVTFRSIDLIRLINTIVPENDKLWVPPGKRTAVPVLSLVRIYAHFSAIESGWMQPSMRLTSEFKDFFGYIRSEFQPLITEREKEWCNTSVLRVVKIPDPHSQKKTPKMLSWKVRLMYCDSKNLSGGGSLEDLGSKIGIHKVKYAHMNIEKMEDFLRTDFDDYCYYGIMDSIISAETHLWYNNVGRYQLGLMEQKERAAGLSSQLFQNIFEKLYTAKNWKRYLGYDAENHMTLAHRVFVQYYHGGRNEVLAVGPKKRAVYYDLRSAYPTSLIMLPDYDFSCAKTFHGEDAERAVIRMEADAKGDGIGDGPFQVAGIVVSFKFRKGVPPIFPVRIDEPSNMPVARRGYDTDGLIFPVTGHTTVTWPELWVARNTPTKDGVHKDLLEELTIHTVATFQNLGTYKLSGEVYDLLKKRNKDNKPMDSYYKQLMNYFYGKTAQAVADASTSLKSHDLQKNMDISAVTCYPLAAYITGFCRAAVAELLQKYECFGITTDGFISPLEHGVITKDRDPALEPPHSGEDLNLGEFCKRVHDRVKDLNPFIGIDSQGEKSLFLKTRGYLLVTGNLLQKMARVGAQTPYAGNKPKSELQADIDAHEQQHIKAIETFLKITERGKCDKVSWRSLPNQRKYWRAELDDLYDFDEVLTRAKRLLTSTSVKVISTDKGQIQFKEAEKLFGRMMANKQLKHTRDTLPLQVTFNDAKVNISFDMKRIPLEQTVEPFRFHGKKYDFVAFETKPLNSLTDFHLLRALAKRTISHKKFITLVSDKESKDVLIGVPYKELEKLKSSTGFPAVSNSEITELKTFFPEVAEHIQNKEVLRLATDDKAVVEAAFKAYVERIEEEFENLMKGGEWPDEFEKDGSREAFERYIKNEIKLKKQKASNSAPYKPPHKKEDYLRSLKGTEFGGDYKKAIEYWLKKNKKFRKKINDACIVFSKPKSKKAIKLDMSFEKEELISFMSRHGGGNQNRSTAKRGFVDEEPVRMELEDYQHMMKEFEKVIELSIEPTPDELKLFSDEIFMPPPAPPLANKLYELLITRRKRQIYDEFAMERNSIIPVLMKSKEELKDNAVKIIAEYNDLEIEKYIQQTGADGIELLQEHLAAGETFAKALETINFDISIKDVVKLKDAEAKKTTKTKLF